MTMFTVGDTGRPLKGRAKDGDVGADCTGQTAAVVNVTRPDDTVFSHAATFTDEAAGEWTMDWQSGDLTVPGTYFAEIEVTFPGPKTQTFGVDADEKETFFFVRAQRA